MKNCIKTILYLVLFVIFVIMITVGQKHVGPSGLVVMLLGLGGLLALLYLYNRKYK